MNKTLFVCTYTAVKKDNGLVLFSQCRPKLKFDKPTRRVYTDSLDVLQRIKHNKILFNIVRGDK